jgi:nucleoside-specific outer membrane channel protein Tsx
MRARRPCRIAAWGCALAHAASGAAFAADFSSSNIELLYGHGFDDGYTGANTSDRNMATFTYESLVVRDWGDSFLFVDVDSGHLVDFAGARRDRSAQVYSEWQPRLSLGSLGGGDWSNDLVRDVFIATQVNAGDDGFYAGMAGLGVDFKIAGFSAIGVNVYLRKDKFNAPTAQVTTFWTAALGGADSHWISEGFVDICGTDHDGVDIMAQPRVLHDVGARFGGRPGLWYAGIEWYYHHNDAMTTSVPQIMIKRMLP